jgi:hypothetical protein
MAAFFCRWGSKHSEIVLASSPRWHRLVALSGQRSAEAEQGRSAYVYLPLIAIRLTFCCAVGDFGRVTLRTPFLKDASILS